ncbi:DUF1294 domain-containing protein [Ureibacillus terrenus]|uniref:DUF1294 domain-containing protein n=1 Tax=Ureibacillus terrenus TaxID=118246 RepID=UPI002E1C2126|nr:DUF1294 domain-containing protein [Ureibacillus terrenus]MED3764766.1 DUF1294 domain-containing protein [Ureibacillus terrenus]
MKEMIVIYFISISAICFALMGIDKSRAKRKKWRISEKALLMSAILGGACGGLIAMVLFRHKTKHAIFALGLPLLAIAQICFFFYF